MSQLVYLGFSGVHLGFSGMCCCWEPIFQSLSPGRCVINVLIVSKQRGESEGERKGICRWIALYVNKCFCSSPQLLIVLLSVSICSPGCPGTLHGAKAGP